LWFRRRFDHTITALRAEKKNPPRIADEAFALTAIRLGVRIRLSEPPMTDQELNRAVQYVTASTSYGRETVESILKTGLRELTELALQSVRRFEREALLEYISQWTIKRTGQPEPLVREVLGCAGRWLNEVCEEVAKRRPESLGLASNDDEDSEPV